MNRTHHRRRIWPRAIMLLALAIGLGFALRNYQRYRAVTTIKHCGGDVFFSPPAWLPLSLQERIDPWIERSSWPAIYTQPSQVSYPGEDRIPRQLVLAMVDLGEVDTVLLGGVRDENLADLARMESIGALSIYDSPISDEGLRWLSPIPSITALSVIGTNVTNAGAADFQRAHPQCTVKTKYDRVEPPKGVVIP